MYCCVHLQAPRVTTWHTHTGSGGLDITASIHYLPLYPLSAAPGRSPSAALQRRETVVRTVLLCTSTGTTGAGLRNPSTRLVAVAPHERQVHERLAVAGAATSSHEQCPARERRQHTRRGTAFKRYAASPDTNSWWKCSIASSMVWLVRDRCEEHSPAAGLCQTHMDSFKGHLNELYNMAICSSSSLFFCPPVQPEWERWLQS